jgi:surface polysaccharide O-acyltransferase-like enzyme
MKKETERQSNFELLRIIAMVLIIIHHITYHVVLKQLEFGPHNIYAFGEMFNNFTYYKRLSLLEYNLAFGKIGNFLFIILSGYFLIDKKDIDIIKQGKKLLSQVIYMIFVLLLASFIYTKFNTGFTGATVFSNINTQWWFVGYYFVVILAGKLFLNKFLNKLSNKEYLSFLLILFAVCQLSFSRDIIEKVVSSTFVYGIFVYSLGGYIKKYNPFKDVKSTVFVLSIILSFVLMTLSYRNQVQRDIALALFNKMPNYYQTFTNYSEYSIIVLIIGLSLFELFRRMNIKYSKVINYIASTTFMIYLFHDNEFIHSITRSIDWAAPLHNDIIRFLLMVGIKTIVVFVITSILYFIYSLIIKYIESDKFKRLIYRK